MRTSFLGTALGLCVASTLAGLGACSAPPASATSTDQALAAAVDVLTQHNDVGRTGVNAREKELSPARLARGGFGKLFARRVDGQVFAQPLYVAGVGGKNVVIVATEHNSVYAFDADAPNASKPLWTVNLGPSVPAGDTSCGLLSPEIGITSTPVIDKASGTIWVSAKLKVQGAYKLELHALDLTTGREKPNSPVEIKATAPGRGAGSANGVVSLDPLQHMNRPGLLKVGDSIVLGFASQCDVSPYHGWIVSYDATSLRQTGVHVDTPDGSMGGIWHGAVGLASDDSGDVFYASGNGTLDGTRNFGNSIVRLHARAQQGGFDVASFFTPIDSAALNARDLDLGSTGVLLVPGTKLAISGDKAGNFYVVDRDQMGGSSPNDGAIVQKFQGTARGAFGGTAYYGNTLYMWGTGDVLKAYAFDGAHFAALAQGATQTGYPGGQLSVSADDATPGTGILWALRAARSGAGLTSRPGAGVLEAYAAADIRQQLWTSEAAAGDALGDLAKFAAPTIANGKVYVGTATNELVVYGLRDGAAAPDAGPEGAADAGADANDSGASTDGSASTAPTFGQVFDTLLGPGSVGHCTNCHANGHAAFKCSNKSDCYASLVSRGLVTPGANASASPLGSPDGSPLAWFGGSMPLDDGAPSEAAADAITKWLAAGAKND